MLIWLTAIKQVTVHKPVPTLGRGTWQHIPKCKVCVTSIKMQSVCMQSVCNIYQNAVYVLKKTEPRSSPSENLPHGYGHKSTPRRCSSVTNSQKLNVLPDKEQLNNGIFVLQMSGHHEKERGYVYSSIMKSSPKNGCKHRRWSSRGYLCKEEFLIFILFLPSPCELLFVYYFYIYKVNRIHFGSKTTGKFFIDLFY